MQKKDINIALRNIYIVISCICITLLFLIFNTPMSGGQFIGSMLFIILVPFLCIRHHQKLVNFLQENPDNAENNQLNKISDEIDSVISQLDDSQTGLALERMMELYLEAYNSERYDEAAEITNTIIKLAPDDARYYALRAQSVYMCTKNGFLENNAKEWAVIFSDLIKSNELEPDNAHQRIATGVIMSFVYLAKEDSPALFEEPEKMFEEATSSLPKDNIYFKVIKSMYYSIFKPIECYDAIVKDLKDMIIKEPENLSCRNARCFFVPCWIEELKKKYSFDNDDFPVLDIDFINDVKDDIAFSNSFDNDLKEGSALGASTSLSELADKYATSVLTSLHICIGAHEGAKQSGMDIECLKKNISNLNVSEDMIGENAKFLKQVDIIKKHAEAAYAIDSLNPRACMAMALLNLALCKDNEAIDFANKAIELDTENMLFYEIRGCIYMLAFKQNDKALEDFQYVLENSSDNTQIESVKKRIMKIEQRIQNEQSHFDVNTKKGRELDI